ncbi:MAG: sugar transferase, partial [Gammaproteobacteria bacterium]|nr:sugar transferase [Gammaproteobacteria bacterium]
AEADGVARWATKNDNRITRVGAVIRKTRLDELPQVFNVLRGEMSLVGPRPERPEFVEQLEKEIPFYAERHRVKPGLTGWAQLSYPYGATINDARNKLEFDLYYVKNASAFLDLIILLETVEVVLWGKGAH